MVNIWRKQKPSVDTNGRLKVTFMPGRKQVQVHRLVLEVFKGPCPEGKEACHYPDTDPFNNRIGNLRWDTHKNNIRDAVRHGRMACGERQVFSKLTADVVRQIRKAYEVGEMNTYELASKHKVRQGTIWYIVARKTWKHVTP